MYRIDIKDSHLVSQAVKEIKPDIIFHLAAETHVDRSLENPLRFIETNIIGTFNILQASLNYYQKLSLLKQKSFRLHHISTDEVFGSLGSTGKFDEEQNMIPEVLILHLKQVAII